MSEHTLALFDFDGTLTQQDSLSDFLSYSFGRRRYYTALIRLSPLLLRYLAGRVSNHHAKQALLGHFFAGLDNNTFKQLCCCYATQRLPHILRSAASDRLRWHASAGHRLVIVTASPEDWIRPWAEMHNIEVIGTQLARNNRQLSGTFAGQNCHGQEKVARIRAAINLHDFPIIHAYGDTRGDLPMLKLATHAYWKPFRDGHSQARAGLPE